MAKIIPSTITIPQTIDHEPDANVDLDWSEIVEALHHIYQRCGAISPGVTFNPPMQRNTDTYGVTDTGGGRVDLDTWAGFMVFQRRLINNTHTLQLQAFMRNARLRITPIRFNSDAAGDYTVMTTLEVIAAGTDSQWVQSLQFLADTDVREGASLLNPMAAFYFYAEMRADDFATNGDGYLWQFNLQEYNRATGGTLPTTPA